MESNGHTVFVSKHRVYKKEKGNVIINNSKKQFFFFFFQLNIFKV